MHAVAGPGDYVVLLGAEPAAAQRPVPGGHQPGAELVADRAPVALEALAATAGVHRAGHGPDGAADPAREVAHDRECGLFVVDRHPGERVLEAERLAEHDQRQVVRQQPPEQRLPLAGQGQQRPVHVPQGQVVAEEVLFLFVLGRRHQQVAAVRAQLAGEDAHEQPEVGVLEQALLVVGDDEGDGAGVAAGEVPRRLVD